MALDIFTQKLGDMSRPHLPSPGNDTDGVVGDVASKMLECVQTVVDVMTDPKTGTGYTVSFANGSSAYTDKGTKRIVISAKPLLDAPKGTPLADIAAILTGFAVHETGHTTRSLTVAARAKWPDKQVPKVLANIVEDVILEAAIVKRYAGFREVFDPTFDWIAKETCPTFPIPWGTTTTSRLNFVGQVVRYSKYVTFASDEATQRELGWFTDWAKGITFDMSDSKAIAHIELALARIHDHSNDPEPDTTEGEGDEEEGEGEDGEAEGEGNGKGKGKDPSTDQTLEEDDDSTDTGTEGGEGEGEDGDGTEGGDGESDGEGKGKGGTDTEGGDSEGADTDGEGEDTEGGDAGIDTVNRKHGGKGSTDGTGAGGSGQTIAEASDPDDGYNPVEREPSFDDLAHGDKYESAEVQAAVETERTTVRMDAKVHGKMRVVFRS